MTPASGRYRQLRFGIDLALPVDMALWTATTPGTTQPAILFDISPAIGPQLQVWPGDVGPTRDLLLDVEAGDNITLSTLRSTVHVGAHADAPSHYHSRGLSIGECELAPYIGPAQVIRVRVERGEGIRPEHLRGVDIVAPRVLFATGTFPDPHAWNEDFAALSPELIDRLAAQGVLLVGLDTPSVDLFSAKQLSTHYRLHAHRMAVLEGLVLDDVPDGRYELIALPLPLLHFDASPVRAILRELPSCR